MRRFLYTLFALIVLTACASGSGPSPEDRDVRVLITPSELIIGVGATVDLSANVFGVDDATLSWESTGGSIERTWFGARFTAPTERGTVRVTATSTAAPYATATATIEVLSDSEARLQVPVAVLSQIPGDLRAVSRLAENRLVAGSNGEFVVRMGDQTTSTVAVMDVERGFGWTAVYPTWFGDSLTATRADGLATQSSSSTIGPLSTAVQMLYAQPAIHDANLAGAERVIRALRDLPEVVALAEALEVAANQEGNPLDDIAVTAAFEDAFDASLAAIPDVANVAISRTVLGTASSGTDVTVRPIDADWTLVINENGTLEPIWTSKGSLLSDSFTNRALDWVGYVYRMDHTRFQDAGDALVAWQDEPWLADVPVAATEPVAALSLSADSFWTRFDLGFLFDYAIDNFVGASEGARMPTEPGLYAVHMYTWGLEGTANNRNDRSLIRSWQGAAANHRTAQAVNVLSFAMDAVTATVPTDLIQGLFLEESFKVSIRAAITGRLIEYGDLSTISRADFERIVSDSSAAVLSLVSNAIKDGTIVAATEGKEALLKQIGKTILKGADAAIGFISAGGKLGYRYDHMTRASSLESWYFVVGDPWDSTSGDDPNPPDDPEPEPEPDPDPEPEPEPGAPAAPDLIAPRGLISTTTPSLEVMPVDGATAYGFYVRDLTTDTLVHQVASVSSATYRVPSGVLDQGGHYRWNARVFVGEWSAYAAPLYFDIEGEGEPEPPPPDEDHPPVIEVFGAIDTNLNVGDTATFEWIVTDPDGDLSTCSILFGDGERETYTDCPGDASASHIYDVAGTYNATFVALDGKANSVSASVTIYVDEAVGETNESPIIDSLNWSFPYPSLPMTMYIEWEAHDPDGDAMICALAFGDDQTSPNYSSCDNHSVAHAYDAPGDYFVVLIIRDEHGAETIRTVAVTVEGSPTPRITGVAPETPPADFGDHQFDIYGSGFERGAGVVLIEMSTGDAFDVSDRAQFVDSSHITVSNVTFGTPAGAWQVFIRNDPTGARTESNRYAFATR